MPDTLRLLSGDELPITPEFEDFLKGEISSFKPASTETATLPEPATFSDGDYLYWSMFEKRIYPGVKPGFQYLDYTTISKMNDIYVLCEGWVVGVIFDKNGNVLRHYHALSRESDIVRKTGEFFEIDGGSISTCERIDDEVFICFDPNYRNYYHWWVEILVGLNYLRNIMGVHVKIMMPVPEDRLMSWQKSSLKLICDDADILYPSSDIVRISRALWVSNLDISHSPASLRRDMVARVLGKVDCDGDRIAGVFIKRMTTRQITNIDEVESALSPLGIRFVCLDDMDQSAEINLFSRAEMVIGVTGAGMSNILFCRPGTNVLELMPSSDVSDPIWLLSNQLEHNYGMIICRSNGSNFDDSLSVNVNYLIGVIEQMRAVR